jgi:hypothetical protein
MTINGLPLPRDLLDLIAAGRWRQPEDMSGIDALFGEHGGFHPYGFGAMRFETESMLPRQEIMWAGAPNEETPPGNIDMTQAILIADIGLGYDQPVALDYRLSLEHPRVLTLRWLSTEYVSPSGELGRPVNANRWIVLAPDIKTFAELAKL